jgi:hypothetical protein
MYSAQTEPIQQAPQPQLAQTAQIAQAVPAGPLTEVNAIPLGLLGRFPATVMCPVCGQLSHTGIRYEIGRGTQ